MSSPDNPDMYGIKKYGLVIQQCKQIQAEGNVGMSVEVIFNKFQRFIHLRFHGFWRNIQLGSNLLIRQMLLTAHGKNKPPLVRQLFNGFLGYFLVFSNNYVIFQRIAYCTLADLQVFAVEFFDGCFTGCVYNQVFGDGENIAVERQIWP